MVTLHLREGAPQLYPDPYYEFRCYGIDLGTTNSTVAEIVWQPGERPSCRILEIDQATQQGQYTGPLIPSVVAILPGDQVWV